MTTTVAIVMAAILLFAFLSAFLAGLLGIGGTAIDDVPAAAKDDHTPAANTP